MQANRLRTGSGLELSMHEVGPDDSVELFEAFTAVVDAGEGYPQAPGSLTPDEFEDYWLDHKSLVALARLDGRLAGSYFLKPNFAGRGAHVANAGYFVVGGLRGQGIGEALVEHSLVEAHALGFDAMQFNLVFAGNPARRLYERMGFREIGRVPEAVDGEDAVIYWRRI
jgi:GNAT superfamily N-acetyltransferase